MMNSIEGHQIFLASDHVDMRKSIDGLVAIVQASFRLDPFSSAIFVFADRQRKKIKILQWDHNGFWLHYKRLETGRFRWPQKNDFQTVTISRRQLNWLMDGLELQQKHAHAPCAATLSV
jgi:transposase